MSEKITATLTKKEWTVLDCFIGDLREHYSNAGCNDLPEEIESIFTNDEGEEMAKQFAILNNPEDPEGPEWPLPDYALLALIRHKINFETGT